MERYAYGEKERDIRMDWASQIDLGGLLCEDSQMTEEKYESEGKEMGDMRRSKDIAKRKRKNDVENYTNEM